MDDKTKKLVTSIVLAYRDLFPKEYQLGAEGNRHRARTQVSKWGEVQGTTELEREVLRMPSALHTALYLKMTPDQQKEFESDRGVLWFQRRFPEWVPNSKVE